MRDTVAELIAAAQAVVDKAHSFSVRTFNGIPFTFADEPELKQLEDALLTHERLGGLSAR